MGSQVDKDFELVISMVLFVDNYLALPSKY